jgi:pimeloyl-ACP methyl ester carboxylesterase
MICTVQNTPAHYERFGNGRPLLMLHGFSPDYRLMAGCMEPLFDDQSGWQRIYLDLPGMGQTPGPEWLTTSDQMLEFVYQFVQQIIPGQRYAVAGESYGGYLTRGLLTLDVDHIQGVMLLCPAIYADYSNRRLPAHEVMEREPGVMDGLTLDEQKNFDTFCVVQTREVWQKMKRDISSGVALADQAVLERLCRHYVFTHEAELDLVHFERPSLILVGRQDSIVGYADAMDLLPHFPHATYAVLDYAGHNLQIEQPAVFNALTLEWLSRVEKGWKAE